MIRSLINIFISIFIATIAFAEGEHSSGHLFEQAAIGDKPGMTLVRLVGYNPGITTSAELLWGESAAYTLPTAALSSPYCASSSTNDTSAGTGLRTMVVSGVKSDWSTFSETVTLNGQTSVNLATTNVYMINSMVGASAGSTTANAGTVRCGTGTNTAGVPAVIHSHIVAGQSISETFRYAVPSGYKLICEKFTLGSYGVTAAQTVAFFANQYNDPINAYYLKSETFGYLNQAGESSSFNDRIVMIPEKTVFAMTALSAASTGPVMASADCLLLKQTWLDSAQEIF